MSGSALGLHSPTLEPVAVEMSPYANELFVMLIYVKSRNERLKLARDLGYSEVTLPKHSIGTTTNDGGTYFKESP